MPAPVSLRARRWALFVLFSLPGVILSSWVSRTPAIRDALHASTTEMGFVILGLSVGSMVGILAAPRVLRRVHPKPAIATTSSAIVLSMALVAVGAATSSIELVTAGLAVCGLGMGIAEIAMNVEGAEVERLSGTTVLPIMHGSFSVGTVIGAAAGIPLNAVGVPVLPHLLVVVVVCFATVLVALRWVAGADVVRGVEGEETHGRLRHPWRDPVLVAIAVVVLAMALAEGSASDWLPLLMVDGHGVDAAIGSAVYALFAVCMAVGRFAGAGLQRWVSRPMLIGVSAVTAAVGVALVVFVDSTVVAAVGAVLWGLGTALGFPLSISIAGKGANSAARVSFVATAGYVAFLVGPPLLGFLGDHWGLRLAMVVVLVLVLAAAGASTRVREHDAGPRKAEPVTDPV